MRVRLQVARYAIQFEIQILIFVRVAKQHIYIVLQNLNGMYAGAERG